MLPDYAALRDELAKLAHPARPDVDWHRVETLSLALFRQNGVELQTTCWFTLARTRRAGMAGLNEGLAILAALVTRQWGAMWPQPVHARMEILSGFSQRLQSALRSLTLTYADLPQVYEAEQSLNTLRDVLARLELKNASQVDELCTFMHNASVRIEKMDDTAAPAVTLTPASVKAAESARSAVLSPSASSAPLVYVVPEGPASGAEPADHANSERTAETAASPRWCGWKAFTAGAVTALVAGAAVLWGWHYMHPAKSPLPVTADAAALKALGQQPPQWLQRYGFMLAAGAPPQDTARLRALWQAHIEGSALPLDALLGWHQGMDGLQEMTRRLNELDERRGKYLTGSELKSMVFAITQNFERAVPVEEQLYQLSLSEKGAPLPPAQISQTEMRLNQLINRYFLITQQQKKP